MIRVASVSDMGLRDNLEDACGTLVLVTQPGIEAAAMAVADGVCMREFGEVASMTTVDVGMGHCIAAIRSRASITPTLILQDAIRAANQAVVSVAAADKRMAGMATTAVLAMILGDTLHVASVGDSRCYLCGPSSIRCITRDHSKVQELIDAGLLTPKEALHHPSAHVITRFLGHTDLVQPDVLACQVRPGDMIVLCTDGLTDGLDDEQIYECIRQYRAGRLAFDRLPECLVHEAIRGGSSDNITVACCEYHSPVIVETASPIKITVTDAYAVTFAELVHSRSKEKENVRP